jgi:5S rRNA maturation endonuclease (ribonuclease M5)
MLIALQQDFPSDETALLEMLEEWLDHLNNYPFEVIIVVEGKKDMTALEDLGIGRRIDHLNKGKNMFDLVSSISERSFQDKDDPFEGKMIILTDWDRKGGILASRLKKACLHLEVDYDMEPRRKLIFLTGQWIKDVESLPSFIEGLQSRSFSLIT